MNKVVTDDEIEKVIAGATFGSVFFRIVKMKHPSDDYYAVLVDSCNTTYLAYAMPIGTTCSMRLKLAAGADVEFDEVVKFPQYDRALTTGELQLYKDYRVQNGFGVLYNMRHINLHCNKFFCELLFNENNLEDRIFDYHNYKASNERQRGNNEIVRKIVFYHERWFKNLSEDQQFDVQMRGW